MHDFTSFHLVTYRATIKCSYLRSFSNKCENHFSDPPNDSEILDKLDFARIRTNECCLLHFLWELTKRAGDKQIYVTCDVTDICPRWNDDVFPHSQARTHVGDSLRPGYQAIKMAAVRLLCSRSKVCLYRSFCCLRIFLMPVSSKKSSKLFSLLETDVLELSVRFDKKFIRSSWANLESKLRPL